MLELQNLLRALDTGGTAELIHPIYGSVNVTNATYQVIHRAERRDYAEVAVQFLESKPGQPFFAQQFEFVDTSTLDMADEAKWQDGVLICSVDLTPGLRNTVMDRWRLDRVD